MKTTSLVTILTLLACFGSQVLFAEEKAKVDFAREVLPILSNKCFVCHGPDTKKKAVSYTHLTLPTSDLV